MMTQDELKRKVGWATLPYILSDTILGIGTGTTVTYLIDALSSIKNRIAGVVSSSEDSTNKLKRIGLSVLNLNDLDNIDIYVDSADEINRHMQMIKGGRAALTREKVLAAMARKFICIVDNSKQVDVLGKFPLPIEVIPMARSWVTRKIVHMVGGRPEYRRGVITDNGNIILDVHNLHILDAVSLENEINNIPGVVTVGLFARRVADMLLISSETGVKVMSL